MPDSPLLERFRLEAELVASSSQEPGPSQRVDALVICGDLPAHARQAMKSLWGLLKAKRVDDLQACGEQILSTLDLAIRVVGAFADHTKEPLRGVQAKLEQIRQEHLDTWPWFRKEDLDQVQAELDRGETVDMDDVFPALAGVSREEWEKRLEARQRQKRSPEGT
jgi:hypothetical protein